MNSMPADRVDLSLILPVYNEVENIRPVVDEILQVLATIPDVRTEVVLVNDGSADGSGDVLREVADQHPDVVRVIELSRNYGQTAALDAGIRHSSGQVIVPMDADGQNDPADLPRLLAEIANGADVVSGWRRKRKDPFVSRRLPSMLANWLIGRLTRVPIHDFGCTLKAYRRHLLTDVRLYGEMHRFIPAYARWQGGTVVEIEVNHRPRTRGTSKYGIMRTFRVILDLMTVLFLQGKYASKPLHLFGGMGFGLMVVAVLMESWVLAMRFQYGIYVHLQPLFILGAVFGLVGCGAIALGLVAEQLSRIYHATTGEPYTIAGCRNVPGQPSPEDARALPASLAALANVPADEVAD